MSSRINPINPDVARLFRARLQEGETVLWQGQPDPVTSARNGAISGRAAISVLLLGLFWLRVLLKVAFSHSAALLNLSLLSPFLLVAVVLAWGAWSASRSALRTGFAVTDRRLLLALSGKEPIFYGREREPWGYVKLSAAASGIGTVTIAPSATAPGVTYGEAREAGGLFTLVAGDAGGPVPPGQNLLPPVFGPAQIFLASGERVLWQAGSDEGVLARSLTRSASIAASLIGLIVSLFTFTALNLGSTPPLVSLFVLTFLLALGVASWFLTRRWAPRKAAHTAADRFYALTDRRLIIARRTSRTEIVQFALNRLEVRDSLPRQHKIRLRTAREGDLEMLHLTDAEEVCTRLTEAVAQAKRERPDAARRASVSPGDSEPDLSGEDPFHKHLRQGEDILWRGDSKGGGRQAATYALGIFTRAALFIVAFPLVLGAGGTGWGLAGACIVLTALVVLSIATTAWGNIRSQEYAITGERLLIVQRMRDRKRHLVQANLREPINITLSVDPKTGRGEFEIACREADAAFAEAEGRNRRFSLSLLNVGDPLRVYNLLTAAHLARPVPPSVWNGEANGPDPFAPFLRPDEAVRWQGRPEPDLAGEETRWGGDRFLPPVWILVWVGLLMGAGHIAGHGWPTAALRALPFAAFALAARYDPKRRPTAGISYALTSQRLFSLNRVDGFTLSDLDLGRVERIITQQKRGDAAAFIFLIGENRVCWTYISDADAVYRRVDGAVAKAHAQPGRPGGFKSA